MFFISLSFLYLSSCGIQQASIKNSTDAASSTGTANDDLFNKDGNSFGSNASIGLKDNFNLDFTTNALPRLSILSNGNVGIGTTAPAYTLDVNGAVNATSLKVNGVTISTGGVLTIATKTTGYTLAASDAGKLILLKSAGTITLPSAVSVGAGFTVMIKNATGATTGIGAANEIECTGGNSPYLGIKSSTQLFSDGTTWYSLGGSIACMP